MEVEEGPPPPGPLPRRAVKWPRQAATEGAGRGEAIPLPPPPSSPAGRRKKTEEDHGEEEDSSSQQMEVETEASSRGASATTAPPATGPGEEGESDDEGLRPEGVDSEADTQPLDG